LKNSGTIATIFATRGGRRGLEKSPGKGRGPRVGEKKEGFSLHTSRNIEIHWGFETKGGER